MNILINFLKFLLPILKTTAIQVAADELSKMAYPAPKRSTYQSFNRYNRTPTSRRPITSYNTASPRWAASDNRTQSDRKHFNDVLMVAFALNGRSSEDVHAWLQEQMPAADFTYSTVKNGDVHLDSWWVANDERFDRSDCDSAVFVAKGKQAEARELLSEHGLLH